MDNIIQYIEPHLIERIEEAKRYAAFIKKGKDIVKLEDAEMVLRYVIAKHYNMPIFSDYFDKLTIDQLFFEVELILNTGEFNPQETSDAIKENQAEVSKFADEMESQWNDLEANDASVENDPIFQMAREFMQTGQFANEKQQFDPNIQQPEVEQAEDSEGVNNDWQRTDLD